MIRRDNKYWSQGFKRWNW